jgi:hypothetical protein
MNSPSPSHDPFASDSYEPWDPFEDVPSQQQTQASKLQLCQFADWDSERLYDEDPPQYIHYSVEWKVTVNNRAIMPKDTEQDVVLALADCWEHILKPKLENFLHKKNRPLESEHTTVVVSVTERSERDLTKRFDDTSIEWAVIERQLVAWGELFRAGKKLRLNLSFNYIDTSQSSTTLSRKAERKGYSSTTRQMLAERAVQLNAEEASSGQPSIWANVYSLMRCPGHPCHLGPHCWVDPDGKKHYKLLTPHLKSLIEYVEQGHTLRSHNDVPEAIREQLYTEERQSVERRKKASSTSTANFPINITNVLPAHYQGPLGSSPAGALAPNIPSISAHRLNIPGLLDEAVEDYCAWQQSRVKKPTLKVEYKKACDVIIEDGMDLGLIHRDPNPEFLTKRGIKRGIAQHIVDDIDEWVKTYKRARTEEQLE